MNNSLFRRLSIPISLLKRDFSKGFVVSGTITMEKGSAATVSHRFSQEDVNAFAKLMGDNNPIHSDPVFASKTQFKSPIVHGIFVSSLISTIFGRTMHGCVYVSQSLKFRRPVHVGAEVIARVTVVNIENRKKGNLITCSTTISLRNDNVEDPDHVVTGEAQVLVPFEGKQII